MEFRHELVMPNEDLTFRMFIFEGRDGNYRVTKHWHNSFEIFLVLEGCIDFYLNSVHYPLEPGDFVMVNPNEIHSIDSPYPNITIVLQIPLSCFEEYQEEEQYLTFVKRSDEQNQQLIQLIQDMYASYEQKEYGYKLKVKSQFFYLIYLLVTQFKEHTADEDVLKQKRQLDKLSRVTEYMKGNYDQELTLEAVAERFGFTPTYLSRVFIKYANINYKTYLTDLRVKYALRELINTNRTISEIALDNGFPNSRAFAKAFSRRYGCLPSCYRKQLEQKKI